MGYTTMLKRRRLSKLYELAVRAAVANTTINICAGCNLVQSKHPCNYSPLICESDIPPDRSPTCNYLCGYRVPARELLKRCQAMERDLILAEEKV